jgi:hypothetical protein
VAKQLGAALENSPHVAGGEDQGNVAPGHRQRDATKPGTLANPAQPAHRPAVGIELFLDAGRSPGGE